MKRAANGSRARALLAVAALALQGACAQAATFGELSGQADGEAVAPYSPYSAGPYAAAPFAGSPYSAGAFAPPPPGFGPPPAAGGAEGQIPPALNAPGAATLPPAVGPEMPLGPVADLPMGTQQLWTFGQINSTTDPFNPWGLSTPHMFVPWSTPLSGWANTQTWNWWRKRSGAVPRNW